VRMRVARVGLRQLRLVIIIHFVFFGLLVHVCFYGVGFSFISTMLSDWIGWKEHI